MRQPIYWILPALVAANWVGCDRKPDEEAGKPTDNETETAEAETDAPKESSRREKVDRTVPDSDIEAAVREELLADDAVESHSVSVEVESGVVTLAGTTDHLHAKQRAVRLASAIRGVRSVVDQIEVAPSDATDAKIQRGIEQSLLLHPVTETLDADVEVEDGVAVLTGSVDSWAEKRLAEVVATSVRGVRDIVNEITIEYAAERPDTQLETDIRARLRQDVRVDEGLIEVDVTDGVAKLTGAVGSVAEREGARDNAWMVGVKQVDVSGLDVEWWARDRMQRASVKTPPDHAIEKAVTSALRLDPRVKHEDIRVHSKQGIVTLTGAVGSLVSKRAAERDAENTTGVWRVRNYLWVELEEAVADPELADRVNEALERNTHLEDLDVEATVKHGTVYLTGHADTPFQRAAATLAATSISGVRAVRNALTVAEPELTTAVVPDSVLADRIRSQLRWDPYVSADSVEPTVLAGVATLEGTVQTWSAYRAALEAARDAGVTRVIDRLEVRHGPAFLAPEADEKKKAKPQPQPKPKATAS